MVRPLRPLLLGTDRFHRQTDALLAVALAVLTFVAYATGLFVETSGVLLVPGDAALVAFVAAGTLGYRGDGLVMAWVVAFAPLFGFEVEWAFLGLADPTLGRSFAFLFDPAGLAFGGVTAVVLGSVGFVAGFALRALLRWGGVVTPNGKP